MTDENIKNIRKNLVSEIEEKIKRLKQEGRNYLHPCCKEFQNDTKNLGFDTGNRYIVWMQQNGILKNPTEVDRIAITYSYNSARCKNSREYNDKHAQKFGYKNNSERVKERNWNKGLQSPMSENEDCSSYFGVWIAENCVSKTFENPIVAPYGTKGYDWICKDGYKIQNKAVCLTYSDICDWSGWYYNINYNNIADYFILSAWNNRSSLEPMYLWIFYKNDIIRERKFWRRVGLSITNKSKYLAEFREYEVKNRLDKLKEICKILKS